MPKAGGADGERRKEPGEAGLPAEGGEGFAEGLAILARRRDVAAPRLLLPDRHHGQRHGQHGRALQHLDQPQRREVVQRAADGDRADEHADEEHGVEHGDDARALFRRRKVGGEREAGGLHRVQAEAGHQEGERQPGLAEADRAGAPLGDDQERDRHQREAAELDQRAEPDVGNAPEAEIGPVRVRLEADQRAGGRGDQRQRHGDRDDRQRDLQLHRHHAVQRPAEQHQRDAHRNLEQRQPEQPAERQFRRTCVGEGDEGPGEEIEGDDLAADGAHDRTNSMPWDL